MNRSFESLQLRSEGPFEGDLGKPSEGYSSYEADSDEQLRDVSERGESRRKWLHRSLGALAAGLAFSSGGVIDKATDPFIDTDKVVEDSIEVSELYTLDSIYSGTKIEDYPDPNSLLSEINQPLIEESEALRSAVPSVQRVMSDLNEHNYDAIKTRAEVYLAKHPDQLPSADLIESVHSRIDSANTEGEVAEALSEAAGFYEVEFGYPDNDNYTIDISALKNTAKGVVDGLARLPASVVDYAELNSILIASPEYFNERDSSIHQTVLGFANQEEKTITMRATSPLAETVRGGMSTIPGAQSFDSTSTEAVFLHEFGHIVNGARGIIGSSTPNTVDFEGPGVTDYIVDAARGMANYPEAISTYSRTSYEESVAENIGGVIGDRSDGLAHPDESRRFSSPANKALIENLVRLEAWEPGLADYFVSINDRLMSRGVLSVGRDPLM